MGVLISADAKIDFSDTNNPAPYDATCLRMDELRRKAELIPAKHVLFLFDCCYSGLAIDMQRGLMMPDSLEAVANKPVRQILTAGLKGQKALELPEKKHGAFTYVLLDALKGFADLNNDGYITGLELAGYVAGRVSKLSPQQTPKFVSYGGEGQFLFQNPSPKPLQNDIETPNNPKDKRPVSDSTEKQIHPKYHLALRKCVLSQYSDAIKALKDVIDENSNDEEAYAYLNHVGKNMLRDAQSYEEFEQAVGVCQFLKEKGRLSLNDLERYIKGNLDLRLDFAPKAPVVDQKVKVFVASTQGAKGAKDIKIIKVKDKLKDLLINKLRDKKYEMKWSIKKGAVSYPPTSEEKELKKE